MSAVDNQDTSLAQLRQRLNWPDSKPLSLISFTIAGVQEFLAAARTTRDVWNGSYLVSYLTFRGTWALLEAIGAAAGRNPSDMFAWVLMPDVSCQPLVQGRAGIPVRGDLRVANFPNSVLVAAPGGKDKAATLARAAEDGVKEAWKEILENCERELNKHDLLSSKFAAEQWSYQTRFDSVFELYWSVLEVPTEEAFAERLRPILGSAPLPLTRYGALIEAGSRVLGSRKMLRDFTQIGQEGDRCSLCGARAALADYEIKERLRNKDRGRYLQPRHGRLTAYWNGVHQAFPHRFRGNERLCAVCLVRRLAPFYYFRDTLFGGEVIQFPSTSTLSAAQAVADLVGEARKKTALLTPIEKFLDALKKAAATTPSVPVEGPMLPYFEDLPNGHLREFAKIDGDWFYPDHYNAQSLAREYGLTEEQARRRFPVNLAAILREDLAKCGHEFQPSNYCCLIRADGDHMGEWVSGRMDPESFTPAWHADLSAALARFAEKIRGSIELEMPGKLVYAGGDDLLAFVPRERVLAALQDIEITFRAETEKVAPLLTISASCVLARHNDPLSVSIKESENLLKKVAKEKYGRQAFAIRRTTGGGDPTGLPMRWGSREPLEMLIAIHNAMAELVATDRHGLSGRIVEQLDRLKDGLSSWNGLSNQLHNARREMLLYAAGRHFTANPDLSKQERAKECRKMQEKVGELYDLLVEWHGELSRRPPTGEPPPDPFPVMHNLLSTLRFLTREGR